MSMIYRSFQDETLSTLAMGTMRLPQNSDKEADIDQEQTARMLASALEAGVNYIDTAYGYHDGASERVMGKLLATYPRESFNLATKFPGYDPANWDHAQEVFEEQLEKCQVEFFDYYLIHNVCEMNIDAYLDEEKYGIVPYLLEQKRNGRIRHLGFSVHGAQDVLERFLDAYGEHMEFCQVQLNWIDWDFQKARDKVAALDKAHIPIWVMEPLRGGKLASLPAHAMEQLEALRPGVSAVEWSFRFLQSIPHVVTILTGASSEEQLAENLAIFETEKPLTDEEWNTLLEIGRMMTDESVPCTACRYCTKYCPQELDIPKLLMFYNQRMFTGKGDFMAPMALSALPDSKKPSACIACHACETACPQQIHVSDVLKEFAEMVS